MKWRTLASVWSLAAVLAAGTAESQSTDAVARAAAEDFFAGRLPAMAARFDERVAQALPGDTLAQLRTQLFGQVGAFQSITSTRAEDTEDRHIVFVGCRFEKAALEMRIVLDADGKIAGFSFAPVVAPNVKWTPPAYARPDAFSEREVTVVSGEWSLPGTLTIPRGDGPFPAVVLVHGSGNNDQDESIGPNKLFKDMAWGLASRGVAVLRYTKRTLKYPGEMAAAARAGRFTVKDETIDDARAAVGVAARQLEIDPKRVFVLGHSLGGRLAPRIAEGATGIAGLIIMAGGSRPLDETIVDQIRYLSRLRAVDDGGKAVAAAEAAAREMRDPALQPTAMVQAAGVTFPGSYLIDIREYHPVATASRLRLPMLIVQGDLDYQCTVKDFDGWKTGLGARPITTFTLYPGLTHLFMSASPGPAGLSTPSDYDRPQHVSEVVIQDLARWIGAAVK